MNFSLSHDGIVAFLNPLKVGDLKIVESPITVLYGDQVVGQGKISFGLNQLPVVVIDFKLSGAAQKIQFSLNQLPTVIQEYVLRRSLTGEGRINFLLSQLPIVVFEDRVYNGPKFTISCQDNQSWRYTNTITFVISCEDVQFWGTRHKFTIGCIDNQNWNPKGYLFIGCEDRQSWFYAPDAEFKISCEDEQSWVPPVFTSRERCLTGDGEIDVSESTIDPMMW